MAQKTVCDRCGRVVGEIEKIASLGVVFQPSSAEGISDIGVEGLDICERCEGPVAKLIARLLLNMPSPEKPRKKRAKKPAPEAAVPGPELPLTNGEADKNWNGEQG